jgi:hypothetical protein
VSRAAGDGEFVTDGIHAALKRAKEAAQGKDVRCTEHACTAHATHVVLTKWSHGPDGT